MINLITLGRAAIQRDGSDVTVLATHKQKFALLVYLAIEGPVSRDRVLGLFWPDRREAQARHSLSQVLYSLRKELDPDVVVSSGSRVAVSDTVAIDVKQVGAAAQREEWNELIGLYGGPFLDQFHLPEAPGFDEWQTRTRAWVAALARRAFSHVIESRASAGDVGGSLNAAWKWAKLEPLEDEAQHALIALLAMSGDRARALSQYATYRARLERELEVDTLEVTDALVERIRRGDLPASPLLEDASVETSAERGLDRDQVGPPVSEVPMGSGAAVDVSELGGLLQGELGPGLEIVERLGESASACVYVAREPRLNRLVAIKVFSPRLANDRRAYLRFEREMQAVGSLTHPNIVGLHWAGALSNGLPYFVMEYVKGRSLADKLAAEGRLDLTTARSVLVQVARALCAAHRRGIVHRDVTPANILYEEETDRAILSDFGIAALLTGSQDRHLRITESGELVGDPAWMSPEQLLGDRATERSDVYGLGLLGYTLVAGRGPYEASTRREFYTAHVREEPRPLRELVDDVDEQLADLLKRCLAKEPARRPAAEHVARVLADPRSSTIEEDGPPSARKLLALLNERRIPQLLAVYLALGFIAVELVDQLVGRWLSPVAYPIALVTYALGAPAIGLFSWFHGQKGRQRFQLVEYWLLATLVVVWLAAVGAILTQ